MVGIAGIVLPAIPGLPIVWAGVLFYGFFTDFAEVTPMILVVTGVLTLLGVGLEFSANALGAKTFGASWFGVVGAFIGGLVGFAMFFIPGLFVGSFFGAFIGEFTRYKKTHSAIKAGIGTILGIIFGTIIKIIILFFILGIFVFALVR
jgi:uncharacterized protein YqgC (DUF456 family)